MLHSLAAHGITADMVVGSSVGALNGAFYAGDPTLKGVERLGEIWRGLKRQDVFPMSWRTVMSFLWRRDFLISHDGIRKLIDDHIPYRNLEDAKVPVHIVTTDIISGDSIVLSEGSTSQAIVASTSIPGAFRPIRYKDYYLADGAISSNTPIQVAVQKGAKRLIILPTGHACAAQAPPVGAVANVLHALTLLIARQLVSELESLDPDIEYFAVPPLCPLVDHLTISRAPPITSSAPSRPPMRGWPSMVSRRARFRMRCGRTLTERRVTLHCKRYFRSIESTAAGFGQFFGVSLSQP
jgi:NTE family protein